MILSLVLSYFLQDGQVLLLDAVILRFLPIHRLLLFHFIVVQILYVLLVQNCCCKYIFWFHRIICNINKKS